MAANIGDAPPLQSPDQPGDNCRDSDNSHPNQFGDNLPDDSNSTNGISSTKTETSSSSRSSSSASASSFLYGEEVTLGEAEPSEKVVDYPTKVVQIAPLRSSKSVQEDDLLEEAVTGLQDEQKQTAEHRNGNISASVKINGTDMITPVDKSKGNHGNTSSPEDAANVPNTPGVAKVCPPQGTESYRDRIKNDTEGSQARSILVDPSGCETGKREHNMFLANAHAAAAANKPYTAPDEIETPQADVNIEQVGGGVAHNSSESSIDMIDVINGRGTADNLTTSTPALISMSTTPDVTTSMSTPKHQPAPPMGAAASQNWVSFEEEEASPSRSHDDPDKKEGWVQFETSPKMQRVPMMPQLTGSSSVHSCDPASEDRQSDVTMSVLSSRGSLSESHDNISHEYLPLAPSPLGPSPSPQPRAAGASNISTWIKFEDPNESPARQLQPPPMHEPLQVPSPLTIQARTSTVSPPSSISSPGHVGSQQVSRPVPHGKTHQAGSKYIAGWISFDEADSSASASPVRSQSTEKEAAEKRLQLQQLQQSIALQQQEQIQSRQLQQQQQPDVIQLPYQQPSHPPMSLLTSHQHATPMLSSQPIHYPADNELSFATPTSSSTPLPGNPFREEVLRQQNRAASPFNPFQSGPVQTPSTPGGTVGAMWGESPITPGTVNAMWEEFEESKAKAVALNRSPGNPFAASVNANSQQVALTATPALELTPTQPQIFDALVTGTTLKEQAQNFQAQSVSEQPSSKPASSSTSVQGTPVSSQPFQRYTKNTKQVTIRASGKRPKVTQTQVDDVVIDNTPFVDEFPREKCDLERGWPMMLRCPDKKRIAGSRFWKPVEVKLLEGNVIQLFDNEHHSEPFRELPLQCSYEFGDRKTQTYDTLGKIHTVKLLYVHYSEKRRYNTRTPYEKVMSANPLLKLGSTDYNIFRSFISTINEYLMKLSSFRDRGISYKQDAMGIVVSDDYRCRITCNGELEKQSTHVDITVLAFLSDMPECSIAVNDVQVKGVEVVSRRDIIPNKTNQWIKLENVELHKCANKNVFVESRCIEFQPLDGCCFSLMKFQTRPRQNAELPLHVKVTVSGEGAYLELRADLLLPGRPGRRDPSQITCDNIMMRIPVPDTWIKYFRRERRLGYYSVKSSHAKPEHIKKGSLNPRLLETSIGSAKYEHAYKAIVWRIDKLPERATVFSASHILMCRIHLASHREVPRTPQGDVQLEFTMPQTTASRTTIRSLAVASDKPSEKRVRYMAHYEYFVEVENKVVLQVLDGDEAPSHCSQQ